MDKEKLLITLREAKDKGIKVSKQAMTSVKDTTKAVINEEKEKYHENQAKGIDNFDDKFKKWLISISPTATFAKWRMNRVMSSYRKEEDEEKGISTESNFSLVFQIFQKFGIGGYIAFFGILVVIVLMILNYLLDLIPYIPFFLFLKYIHIHYKYNRNGRHFDWYWFINLIKEDYSYRPESITDTYYTIPLALYITDNELENYLEKRGKKDMVSKQREYASISNSRIEFDEKYGWIRVFQIDNRFFKKSVNSLEDVELTDYFIIPQRTSNHDLNNQVYYAVHNEVRQSISHLIGIESVEDFISRIVNDSSINAGFDEIAEQLHEQRQREIDEEKFRKERIELEQLEARIFMKNMSKDSVSIIKSIQKNKENWSFNLWNVGENMTGNDKYFRVRCQLLGNATMSTITSLIPTLEREFRKSVIIKQLPSDRKSFELTVILSENLPDVTISTEEMYEKYNSKGKILIGDSYTGWQSYKFSIKNLQAYWTSGGPGAGKSWTNLFLLKNLIQLRNIDDVIPKINEFYIVSDSKVSDYRFLQDKAFIASSPESVLQLLNYLIEKCEEREKLFMEKGVTDILEYNKKIGYMSPFVFVEDEYENSVLTNMKNFNKDYAKDEINQASAKLHRIMRSAGGISITSTQSAILDNIKDVGRYVNIKFFGRNNYSDVKSAASAKLADKFNELGQNGDKVQGLVGFQSKENLLKNAVFLDKAGTAMIKVPILEGEVNGIEDILETKNFEQEILQKNILDENFEEEDELGVDPY